MILMELRNKKRLVSAAEMSASSTPKRSDEMDSESDTELIGSQTIVPREKEDTVTILIKRMTEQLAAMSAQNSALATQMTNVTEGMSERMNKIEQLVAANPIGAICTATHGGTGVSAMGSDGHGFAINNAAEGCNNMGSNVEDVSGTVTGKLWS